MIPSLTLRNILETISKLSIAQLQKYFQSYYGEQNATDLTNNLTSMVQFLSESSYVFVINSLCDEELLSAITKAACYKRKRDVLLSKSKNPKQQQHVFEASVCSSDPKHNKASGNDISNGNSRIGDSSSNPVLKLTSIVESLTLHLSSLQNDIVT